MGSRNQNPSHKSFWTVSGCWAVRRRVASSSRPWERVRRWYDLSVFGYVVMPEHVHLLVSEPEHSSLTVAIQMLKQIVLMRVASVNCGAPIWQQNFRRVAQPF